MTLGSNEKLIRVYEYCRTSENQEDSLVITDRRVVAVHRNQHGMSREEIRIADIRSVDSSWHSRTERSPAGGIVLLLGLILAICAFIIPGLQNGSLMWVVFALGVALVVVGIFLFILLVKKDVSVKLHIITDVIDGHALSVEAARLGIPSKATAGPKEILLTIDPKQAMNIAEEVGTIIWSLQIYGVDSFELKKETKK